MDISSSWILILEWLPPQQIVFAGQTNSFFHHMLTNYIEKRLYSALNFYYSNSLYFHENAIDNPKTELVRNLTTYTNLLEADNWVNVKSLYVRACTSLPEKYFPSNVTHLEISSEIDCDGFLTSYLPMSLKCLNFKRASTLRLTFDTLPSGLQILKLGTHWSHPIKCDLPLQLTKLCLGKWFNYPLPNISTLSNLQCLKVGKRFEQELHLPSQLQRLELIGIREGTTLELPLMLHTLRLGKFASLDTICHHSSGFKLQLEHLRIFDIWGYSSPYEVAYIPNYLKTVELPTTLECLRLRGTIFPLFIFSINFNELINLKKIQFITDNKPLNQANEKVIGQINRHSYIENPIQWIELVQRAFNKRCTIEITNANEKK